MKIKTLGLLIALVFNVSATAKERIYVEGDGGLDFQCKVADTSATPFANFKFQLFWDTNTGKSLFELISDENLKSGNGDLVYKIDITQSAFYGSKEFIKPMTIPGCEHAIIMVDQKSETKMEIYFECSADGDTGYGTIVMDSTALVTTGKITFPEGQRNLTYPLIEDTTYDLICE